MQVFAYIVIVILWVFLACLVWLAAGLMLLFKRTNSFARPLSWAVAGTFPFVFGYQAVSAPFIAVLLIAALALGPILEPHATEITENPLVIFSAIAATFLLLMISLAGFYEGWRVGWICARGQSLREALRSGPTVRLVARVLPRATVEQALSRIPW
ncbi:MAG: hypothetical protein ABI824_14175 [Acidobacteriota bacterium]